MCVGMPYFNSGSSTPSSPLHRSNEFERSYDKITFNNSPPAPAMRQHVRLSKKVSEVKMFPKNPLTGEALIKKGGSMSPDPVRSYRETHRGLRMTGSISLAK